MWPQGRGEPTLRAAGTCVPLEEPITQCGPIFPRMGLVISTSTPESRRVFFFLIQPREGGSSGSGRDGEGLISWLIGQYPALYSFF